MSKVNKSFTTLGLAGGILDGVVACVIESEKKAKSSRSIQTIDVSRRGFRQDIYIGKIMVVPHQIMDDPLSIPDPLLKGAVIKLFDGEDAAAMEMHRLSTNEYDNLSEKDLTDYKDKVFRDDSGKLGCVVLFQPAWGNFRDFQAFRFTKDVPKLHTLIRHLVFAAYYRPSLSALYETLEEDAIRLDAVNLEHDHLGLSGQFAGEEKSYPVLDKFEKKGGLKKRAEAAIEDEKEAAFHKISPDEFVKGYLEAALWTSGDEVKGNNTTPTTDSFSEEALAKADADCSAFVEMAGDHLSQDLDTMGHLFWLNRNGQGSGFWDEGSLDEADQQFLDELAHQFGECDLYLGDNGEVELSGGRIPAPLPAANSGHVLPKEATWIRFTPENLNKIAAEKMNSEEMGVMAELENQLEGKLGSDETAFHDPDRDEPEKVSANFPNGVIAGDADSKNASPKGDSGSMSYPCSSDMIVDYSKSGLRGVEDDTAPEVEKVAVADKGLRCQPDYGEADSYTSEMNEANAKNATGNSPQILGEAYCDSCDSAYPDGTQHHCKMAAQTSLLAGLLNKEARKLARQFYCWGYRDHLHNLYRPFNDSHAEEANTALGPRGIPTAKAYELIEKWNRAPNQERYTPVVEPHESTPSSYQQTRRDREKGLIASKTAADSGVHNGYTDMRDMFCPKPADTRDNEDDHKAKKAADRAISSAANRVVEQHRGEFFTKETLSYLLKNVTDQPKKVFQFLKDQGLVQEERGKYKILSYSDHEGGWVESSLKAASGRNKEALTFFTPAPVLKEFYPEVADSMWGAGENTEHSYNAPPLQSAVDGKMYDGTGDADIQIEDFQDGGMPHSNGGPAPQTQDDASAPLKPNERSIRGPFFIDQFYRQHADIPPALLTMKSSLNKKTASKEEKIKLIGEFFKRLAGEIGSSLLAAFMLTSRPLFTYTPAFGELCLTDEESFLPLNPLMTSGGVNPYANQLKALLTDINDGDLAQALNGAWAQGAVWHESETGKYLYEVFVRIEEVDTESLTIKYKYVTGTKE